MKRAIVLVLFGLMLTLTTLGVLGCMGETSKQQAMLDYLSAKYGEPFVAEQYVKGNTLDPDNSGGDRMLAHPVSAPDQIFWVTSAASGSSDANPSGFEDDRVQAKWAADIKTELKPALESIFGSDVQYAVRVNTDFNETPGKGVGSSLSEYIADNPRARHSVILSVLAPSAEAPASAAIDTQTSAAWAALEKTGASNRQLYLEYDAAPTGRPENQTDLRLLSLTGEDNNPPIDPESWGYVFLDSVSGQGTTGSPSSSYTRVRE